MGPSWAILSDLKAKRRYAPKPAKTKGKSMFWGPRRLPIWLQNGIVADWSPLRRHLGATCRQHGSNLPTRFAYCRQHGGQDGNLEATWPNLGRTGAVLGGSGAVWGGLGGSGGSKALSAGSKGWRFWCGLADCAKAVEDEVFEEEESAEVEGGPARPCHPACSRGRRIQSLRAFRQAAFKGRCSRTRDRRHMIEAR